MGAALINTDINEDAVESQQTNTLKTTTTTNWSNWDNCGVPCDTMHVFKAPIKIQLQRSHVQPNIKYFEYLLFITYCYCSDDHRTINHLKLQI